MLRQGSDITLVGYGTFINVLLDTADRLAEKGISAEVVKLGRITPLQLETAAASVRRTGALLAAEESISSNSVGRRLAAGLALQCIPVKKIALQDLEERYVPHGSVEQLRELCGLSAEDLTKRAEEVLRHA